MAHNIKLAMDKKKIKQEIKEARMKMRDQRKARDDAKLSKKGSAFVKAKTQVVGLKAKINIAKKNLRAVVADMKQTKATMKDNKSTLEKIQGKKQTSIARSPHDRARLTQNVRIIQNRSSKIFNLENRLARTIAYIKFAKKQKNKMSAVYMKQLQKRAHRLAKRLHRKHKELMRVLIRKHRTNPHFKAFWTKAAKRVFALSKADEPIAMSTSDKATVIALKKKVMDLFEKHKVLVGKKQSIRLKIRQARQKIAGRKQTKKDAKKNLKAAAKIPMKSKNDVKKVEAAKKEADKRKFKLRIARLNRKANKEHRHNLRKQDRAVMSAIKKIQASIFKLSGKHFKRPNLASTLPLWKLKERQARKTAKVKRSAKKMRDAQKKLRKARYERNYKAISKWRRRFGKFKKQIFKRTARLNHFRQKKLRNPQAKTEKKVNKKNVKKQNKYKAKKQYITKRVSTHRKKNLNKQAEKNDLRAAKKATKKATMAAKLPVAKPKISVTAKVNTKGLDKIIKKSNNNTKNAKRLLDDIPIA